MDKFLSFIVFTSFWLIICVHFGVCQETQDCQLRTHPSDVQALREAARELGRPDWDCTDDPCLNRPNCWYKNDTLKLHDPSHYINNVTCLCQDGWSRIQNISFKGQDLSGVLPGSLSKLPFLQLIDLARNLLSGSIPREWASMKNLTYLSVMTNNLSGPIPLYLRNMTSLTYISFESNRFSGAVPAELGDLINLESFFHCGNVPISKYPAPYDAFEAVICSSYRPDVLLLLNDNSLTGQLPEQLKKLNNLEELRLGSNNFTGRLPDFFGNWTKLLKLEVQGCGFEGPIPPSISLLHSAKEIRISDLSGDGSKFPSLQSLDVLKRLVLRNCKISGTVPDYIAKLPQLESLDLSFNSLEGTLPSDPTSFRKIEDMFLMHNMLTGPVPPWTTKIVSRRVKNIDLSYNRFDEISGRCDNLQNRNLFKSFKGENDLESTLCIKQSHTCSKVLYELHINCGGEKTKVGKTTYEQDDIPGSVVKFVPSASGVWGFCSSGEYWNAMDGSDFKLNDSTPVSNGSKLFQSARISATSLTYYGICLGRGKYKVTLYFSEIVFASNKSFSSLGNRKFDIYIQENRVYRDFDILSNNGKAHQPVTIEFYNINVNNSIEIRLTYAGKGSTAIPDRISGSYGPLISAISVESEFKPPLSRLTIIMMSIGGVSFLVLVTVIVFAVFWWRNRGKDIPSREEDLSGFDLQSGLITYRQIKAATNDFDTASKIGEGGFGSVYLGTLLDGTNIAVKQLSSNSSQGHREFINEIGMISGLHHPNLARLYGCCVEGNQLFLIYEYMENNNLARALFGTDDDQLILDWPTRKRISIDTARGLTFLHEESTIKIVHRDIKATNILLDRNFNAKISDFGLAKLDEDDHTHISTRVAGTVGYMAPEYALWGYLTYKADVYSFGVVLLEIVAGRSNTKFRSEENHFCLLDWASVLKQKGDVREIVDPRLGKEYNEEEAVKMLKIALLCTNGSPELRPHMSLVLAMLDGSRAIVDSTLDPTMQGKDWLYQFYRSQNDQTSDFDTQSLIISGDAPGGETSSTSDHDLYPVNLLQHKGYNYH